MANAYRTLQEGKLLETAEGLAKQIASQFPGSGLAEVAVSVVQVTKESVARAETIRRPNLLLRIGLGLLTATGVVGAVAVALYFKQVQARNAVLDVERTRLIAEINALAATATGRIDDFKRTNQELQELMRERDELRRARETNAAPQKAPDKGPSRPTPPVVKPPKADNKPCDPDDPMAGCLPLKR